MQLNRDQLEITVLDQTGRISARLRGADFTGQLPASLLDHQQALHLLLRSDDDGSELELRGRVFGLDAGRVEIYAGLRFVLRRVEVFQRSMPPTDTDDSGEHACIYGSLRGMCVAELVQSLQLGRKSVQLDVLPRGRAPGVLGLRDGRLVHASVGDICGEDAFFILATARRGRFSMRFGAPDLPHNLDRAVEWLLLEAARRDDERAVAVTAPVPARPRDDDIFSGETEIVRRRAATAASAPVPSAPLAPPPIAEQAWPKVNSDEAAFGSFFDEEGDNSVTATDIDSDLPAFTSLKVALRHIADSSIVHMGPTQSGGFSDSSSGASTPNG